MIEYKYGNIFEDKSQALVNPFLDGKYLGKIEREFSRKFPDNHAFYSNKHDTENGLSRIIPFYTGRETPRLIINCRSRRHNHKTTLKYMADLFYSIASVVRKNDIKSIAIPFPLDCYDIDLKNMEPKLENAFRLMRSVHVRAYEPEEESESLFLP